MGTIILFAGNFAPQGWFTCEGQTLPVSQYSALFSILGTYYGGDGQTTFKLPDLRGVFPTQCTNINSAHPGGTYTFGQVGGAQNATITAANMPPHTHTIVKGNGSNLTGTVSVTTTVGANDSTTGSTASPAAGSVLGQNSDPGGSGAAPALYNTQATSVNLGGVNSVVANNLSFDPTGLTLTPWGSGPQPVPTVPNFVAMQYIIAVEGIYPTRP
jgi:microcystin-dependent protein